MKFENLTEKVDFKYILPVVQASINDKIKNLIFTKMSFGNNFPGTKKEPKFK